MTTINEILNGKTFRIYKLDSNRLKKNCVYCKKPTDIPYFLINDNAITILKDGIKLNSVEGPAYRFFPVYICWERVSKEDANKVFGEYSAWPKDSGANTLIVKGNKCYTLPTLLKVALITKNIPDWVLNSNFPISRENDTFDLFREDLNEHKKGKINESLWIEYSPKDINILPLTKEIASKYIISFNNQDIGLLTEILK